MIELRQYRGKAKSGEWIKGWAMRGSEKAYIVPSFCFDISELIEVDPETVSQFTGLTDKEGNEIYEGDILFCRHCTPKHYKVIFEEGRFIAISESGAGYIEAFYFSEEAEVIGNVHEHKELLNEN